MILSIETVRHIARLARLQLSAEEEQRYAAQLSAVLDYAARLQQVDTSGIPPTANVLGLQAPLRPDEPRPSPGRAKILANAPAPESGMFSVPRVLEGEP